MAKKPKFKVGDIITDKTVNAEILKVEHDCYTVKILKPGNKYAEDSYDLECKSIDKEKDITIYVPLSELLKKL